MVRPLNGPQCRSNMMWTKAGFRRSVRSKSTVSFSRMTALSMKPRRLKGGES